MGSYRLKQKELLGLEDKLRSFPPISRKDGEVLDKETFALIRVMPEIIRCSLDSLHRRVTGGEFGRSFFFQKKRASTYALLTHLGMITLGETVEGIVINLQNAQDRLTRFLSMYAPGSLSDTEGNFDGSIHGKFIHQCLSSLFMPAGFVADVNVDSDHHTITYGGQPLDLSPEVGINYLKEMGANILACTEKYRDLAPVLAFVTEICGQRIDFPGQIQSGTKEISTQIDSINFLLRDLSSSEALFKTSEGIKKFVVLHNSLGYLTKDIPLKDIQRYLSAIELIFNDAVAPYFALLWRSRLSVGALAAMSAYAKSISSKKNLQGALDLLPTHQKFLEYDPPNE